MTPYSIVILSKILEEKIAAIDVLKRYKGSVAAEKLIKEHEEEIKDLQMAIQILKEYET